MRFLRLILILLVWLVLPEASHAKMSRLWSAGHFAQANASSSNGEKTGGLHKTDEFGNRSQIAAGKCFAAQASATNLGPFGEPIGASGDTDACPFRYQTKWFDAESEHYYFGYRYYDPRLGRWLSRDPLGEEGGINLYAYCGNDPVNKWDYLGLKLQIAGESITSESSIYKALSTNPLAVEIMDAMISSKETYSFQNADRLTKDIRFRELVIAAMDKVNDPKNDVRYVDSVDSPLSTKAPNWSFHKKKGALDMDGAIGGEGEYAVHAELFESLFKGPTRLECTSAIVLCELYALHKYIGETDPKQKQLAVKTYNFQLVGGLVTKDPATSYKPGTSIFGDDDPNSAQSYFYKWMIFMAPTNHDDLIPGDAVNFENLRDYSPTDGFASSWNVIYMGNKQFSGLELSRVSAETIKAKLIDGYRKVKKRTPGKPLPERRTTIRTKAPF